MHIGAIDFRQNYRLPKRDTLKQNFKKLNRDKTIGLDSYFSSVKNVEILNSISFCAKNDPKDPLSYESFIEKAEETGIYNQEDVEANLTPENYLGGGMNSKVYSFSDPLLSAWAVKVDKNQYEGTKKLETFKRVEDEFPNLNLGQEIAKIGDKSQYHILKKIEGNPHSVENWSFHIGENRSIVSSEEALDFLSSIEKIAKFPQSSFDDYAIQLEQIDKKGYKMDSLNPNNLLIDYNNQKINIIDFTRKEKPAQINSRPDLIIAVLDFCLFNRFYEKLDEKKQQQLIENSKIIVEKCNNAAAKIPSLAQDEETCKNYIKTVDKYLGHVLEDVGGTCIQRYDKFKSLVFE